MPSLSPLYSLVWILLDTSTRQSRHTREFRHLLQNKFALGRENAQHVQILLQNYRVELLPNFSNNFLQLAATLIAARQGRVVGGKTRNIALQPILQ